MKIRAWIEALRLRTLPVSAAGVVVGAAMGVYYGCLRVAPVVLALLFALVAQIGCNFANEYYDFRHGLDRPGRVGPRRGVTEGDISPYAMARATVAAFALAALIGLSLIYWGGWWLILAGVVIFVGALSYSAGPFPLSQHSLGEVAVLLFFGLIPVCLTFYLQSHSLTFPCFLASWATGLLGANILIVNNYRDAEADRAVGKNTIVVHIGRGPTALVYLINGLLAVVLTIGLWLGCAPWTLVFPALYLCLHICLWWQLRSRRDQALNPLLGLTAALMLLFALMLLLAAALTR